MTTPMTGADVGRGPDNMSVSFQTIGIDEAVARLHKVRDAMALSPRSVIKEASTILRDALYTAAPKKTGALARSIRAKIISGPAGAGTMARFEMLRYGKFVIEGTRPHDIWAGIYTGNATTIPAAALHFFASSGEEVFTPYVRHPGTKPNDFVKEAWKVAREPVYAMLRETGRRVLRGEELRELGPGIL